MANEYLVSTLIDAIRQTGLIPPGEAATSTTRLIAIMNREQRTYLTRLLLRAREEYQLTSVDVPIVAGTTTYAMPRGAVGNALKNLELVADGVNSRPLSKIPEEQHRNAEITGVGGDYYFQGNNVVIIREFTGTLRFNYFRRLNKLVQSSEAGEISNVNTGAHQVTISAVPTAFTGTLSYDFIQGAPPFDTLGTGTATIASSVLTFSSLPATLAQGDFVALTGQTPICQAPLELHDVLVQRAVVKVLEAKRDPGLPAAQNLLKQLEDDALALISPRAQASSEVLIPYNAPGWRRAMPGLRRWRWR